MNKNKLFFIFLFSLNIFTISFCMKRSRETFENEIINLDENISKKRNVTASKDLIDIKNAIEKFNTDLTNIKNNPQFKTMFSQLPENMLVSNTFDDSDDSDDSNDKITKKININIKDITNFDLSDDIKIFNEKFLSGNFKNIKFTIDAITNKINTLFINLININESKGSNGYSFEDLFTKYNDFCEKLFNLIPDNFLCILQPYFLYCYENKDKIELEKIFKMINYSCYQYEIRDSIKAKVLFILKSDRLDQEKKYEIMSYVFDTLKIKIFSYDLDWNILFNQNWKNINLMINEKNQDNDYCAWTDISENETFYTSIKKISTENPIKFEKIVRMLLEKKIKLDKLDIENIDWLNIFCIAIISENKNVLNLLKDKINPPKNTDESYSTNKTEINSFSTFDKLFEEKLNKIFPQPFNFSQNARNPKLSDGVKTSFISNPLFLAISSGNLEIVKFIIEKCNANINILLSYDSIRETLSENNSQNTVKYKFNKTPIIFAIENNKLEIAEYLFGKGVNLDFTNYALIKELSENNPIAFENLSKTIIKKENILNGSWQNNISNAQTIFCIAILAKNKNVLNLLKDKIDLSKINDFSTFNGLFNKELIKILPQPFNITQNAQNPKLSDCVKTNFISNPLFLAISSNSLDIVKFIVEECKADVKTLLTYKSILENKIQNNGQTSNYTMFTAETITLITSIENKKLEISDYLLKNGANINFINKTGSSMLHLFINSKNEPASLFLIEKDINTNIKNNNNQTALDIAIAKQCSNLNILFKLIINSDKKDQNGKIILPEYIKKNNLQKIQIFFELIKFFPQIDENKNGFSNTTFFDAVHCLNKKFYAMLEISLNAFALKNPINGATYLPNKNILYNSIRSNFQELSEVVIELFKMHKEKLIELNKENNKSISCEIISILLYIATLDKQLKTKNIPIDIDLIKKPIVKYIKNMLNCLNENSVDINKLNENCLSPISISCNRIDTTIKDLITGATIEDCITKDLIEKYKSDVNTTDKDNKKPLFYATINGNKSAIEALLKHNAQLNNLDGKNANFYELLKTSPADNTSKDLYKYFALNKNLDNKFDEIINQAKNRKEILSKKIFPRDRCIVCFDDFADPYLEKNNLEKENSFSDDQNNTLTKRIFFLKCGHDICRECLKNKFLESEGPFKCPDCREKIILSTGSDIEFDSKELRGKTEKKN